jgi:hypothetical protein
MFLRLAGFSISRGTLDASERQRSSPVATALDKALARLGLSLRQFAQG